VGLVLQAAYAQDLWFITEAVAVVLVIAEVVAQAVSVEAEPVVALVAQELLAQPTRVAVAVARTKRLLLVLAVAESLLFAR
jgi:hypothetical protein